ncbi:hypothetical protein LtaPh_0411000 [Leishmania tarentolae]|uniref:Uncharacterized protein n=1 Tax=Leishmania tarentolae TaxID=5689 RepID=A0A640K9B6_LEITA|nr:hypothetical protein LtaPh_0411000 [Leishmania tarentolae]
MSSAPNAPRPAMAKRRAVPQYLAPGQHLKVASRKPAPKPDSAAGGDAFAGKPPRDPWEDSDESDEGPLPSSAGHSGTQGDQHATAGGAHSHSDGFSMSDITECTSTHSKHGSINGLGSMSKVAPPSDGLHAAGGAGTDRNSAVNRDEDDTYYTTSEPPKLSATERAKQLLEAQHRALEAKQLKTLLQQGVARRPTTLVRNRHGRLNAIAAHPASEAAEGSEPTKRITSTPTSASVQPEERRMRASKAPEAGAAPSVSQGGEGGSDGVVDSPRDSHDDLVDSCPSRTVPATKESLEIDLD